MEALRGPRNETAVWLKHHADKLRSADKLQVLMRAQSHYKWQNDTYLRKLFIHWKSLNTIFTFPRPYVIHSSSRGRQSEAFWPALQRQGCHSIDLCSFFSEIGFWPHFINYYFSVAGGPFESIWNHNLRRCLLRLSLWMGPCGYRLFLSNCWTLTKMNSGNVSFQHLAGIVAGGRPTLPRPRTVLRTIFTSRRNFWKHLEP